MRLIRALGVASLVLFVLFLLALRVKAELKTGRVGRAPLFLLTEKFNVRAYVKSAPRHPHAIAILWDVPSRTLKNLKTVLAKTNVTEIELVLINETCVHNRVCESRDSLSGYTKSRLKAAVTKRSPRFRALVSSLSEDAISQIAPMLGTRKIILSPLLETRLRRPEWVRVARWVRQSVGNVPLVYNPLTDDGKPRPPAADYFEKHGFGLSCDPDRRTIANLDGSRGSVAQMQEWVNQTRLCRLSLLWVAADNCRDEIETEFVAPSERLCKGDFSKIRRAIR